MVHRWVHVAALIVAVQAVGFAQGPKAILKGRVADSRGAVFVAAKVVAKCKDSVRSTETSGIGEYEMELEPGICDVHVEPPSAGMSTAHRAPMRLEPGSVITANFTLFSDFAVVAEYSATTTSSRATATLVLDDVPLTSLKYERVVSPGSGPLTGLIRFGHKHNSGKSTIYRSGMLVEKSTVPAVEFTYNLFRLVATEIILDNTRQTIYAAGDVTADLNGITRGYQGSIQVSLKNGKVLIKTNPHAGKESMIMPTFSTIFQHRSTQVRNRVRPVVLTILGYGSSMPAIWRGNRGSRSRAGCTT
jgi:hypothetical protein